ncbi:MAG: class I SAM-dependent methyltransferase [Cellvibrionaceae bacterium]|nr:class I SAM-dependent methyltransferase [Cellvibrionaceae bacterium]MCV6627749.1 class I SAM-dependent methyltransferase [Cellvibrionaceae bacterium]
MAEACPLCKHPASVEFFTDKRRHYRRCPQCDLVFVAEQFILSAEAEKAEYDKHQNHPGDQGYRRFLNRCLGPVLSRQAEGAVGLDFGCGPGPTLSAMAKNAGFDVNNYDPFYFPDQSVFNQSYDFITLTEVIEHIADPGPVIEHLLGLLKADAWLAVMTKRHRGREAFANWHYKNDPTHIRFYSDKTFEYLARAYGLKEELIGADVVLLQKLKAA